MDFERAAARLVRDQRKHRDQQRQRKADLSGRALVKNEEVEAEQRKVEERLSRKREEQRQRKYVEEYMRKCDASLGVQHLTNKEGVELRLKATSIYGEGDKIALPPSVLEFLSTDSLTQESGNPWIFRLGIPNPDYQFPQSKLLEQMKPKEEEEQDDDGDETLETTAYLDELDHRYLAWTHATVVEFTQDEGFLGLPSAVAAVLTDSARGVPIPVTRTVDPSMDVDDKPTNHDDENDEKTPGHLAWGMFDIPDIPIEISLVQLPKGQACSFVPTSQAIKNGFYKLNNVKLVLEQSLIRTRAVLSVGDVVSTWHRGVQYDLQVKHVKPHHCRAILCINTDLNIDFVETQDPTPSISQPLPTLNGHTLAGSPAPTTIVPPNLNNTPLPLPQIGLPPEPELGAPNVCTIQIRNPFHNSKTQRRFDITTATMAHLFTLANSLLERPDSFQLATRMPRRVFVFDTNHSITLQQAGMQAGGQELLWMERPL